MWMCIYLYIVYRDMLDTFGYYKNVWKDKRSLPVPTPIVRFASWQMQQWYSCKMPLQRQHLPMRDGTWNVRPDVYAQFSGHLKSIMINHGIWTCPTFWENLTNHCWVASIYTTRTRNKIGRFTNQNGEILHRWESHVGNQMLVSMPIINDLRSSAMLDFNIFNRILSGKLT